MAERSSRTRGHLWTLGLVALLTGAAATLGAGGGALDPERVAHRHRNFNARTAPPPWRERCPVSIAAHEDGSASLYCGAHNRPFAAIDAESGRIRMRMPPTAEEALTETGRAHARTRLRPRSEAGK